METSDTRAGLEEKNSWRIDQLEQSVSKLDESSKLLSIGQTKQMFQLIGIPVVLAAGLFGAAVWVLLADVSTTAAERQAQATVDRLKTEIEEISSDINDLQKKSEGLFEGLLLTGARTEAAAETISDRVLLAEQRATEAQLILKEMQQNVETVGNLQDRLADVESMAQTIAEIPAFQTSVRDRLSSELGSVKIHKASNFTCDARGKPATGQWAEICRHSVRGIFPAGYTVMYSVPYFYSRSAEIPPVYSLHFEKLENQGFDIILRTAHSQLNEMVVQYLVLSE